MAVAATLALVAGCEPYERFNQDQDDSLGPVQTTDFPAENLGTQSDGSPGNRRMSGLGIFGARAAFVAADMPVAYFDYPVPEAAGDDPLDVASASAAYIFPPGYQCTPPAGYVPDRRLDEVPLDRQYNVYTALPDAHYSPETGPAPDYLPVVAELEVTPPQSLPCQQMKVDTAIERLTGVKNDARMPSGRYLAHLIIDPGAAVLPPGMTIEMHPTRGIGLQSWGWYNRYLLAYIDGGAIPTRVDTDMGPMGPPKMVERMVTQALYYPRSMVLNAGGMPAMAPGARGAGYDVLAARRGSPGYSPVCEVFTYDAGMPLAPEQLPKDEATIKAMFNTPAAPITPDVPPYVFCLQGATP
jgi:hypothetical protein